MRLLARSVQAFSVPRGTPHPPLCPCVFHDSRMSCLSLYLLIYVSYVLRIQLFHKLSPLLAFFLSLRFLFLSSTSVFSVVHIIVLPRIFAAAHRIV